MSFRIRYAARAIEELRALERSTSQIGLVKQIKKAIAYLQTNPKHPSLNTHVFTAFKNPYHDKDKVFEAYVQNKTPGAHRIFWCYGPEHGDITIIAIIPHS